MSCNYGCATLPAHQQVVCSDYSLGGISAVFALECDHTITDFSSQIQWQANINAGKVHIFNNVKGEIPASSPNMQDNPVGCGPEQILMGRDNQLHWIDKNVTGSNDDMYARLDNRRLIPGAFMCEEDEVIIGNASADFTIIPRTVPMNNREVQQYDVVAAFYSKRGEIPFRTYNAPSGIFADN